MKIKKITAVFLAFVFLMLCGCTSAQLDDAEENTAETETEKYIPVYFKEPAKDVLKTETVYVNLKNDGSVSGINVSDWIHTEKGEVYVDDVSDLKNITNVKSNVLPVTDGNKLRWHMPDSDIYYSGISSKKLPLEINITYFLNGKEISTSELAGKSGDVKIKVKMINKEYKKGFVNGSPHNVYLPMLVVGGMMLPEDIFSSVSVQNGQSIGDGSKEIIVFTGMPGFSESLGIDKGKLGDAGGLIIGDEAVISAKVNNFRLSNIYFAALPIASLNLDFAVPETVSDLKNTFAALKSFQNALDRIDPERLIYDFISDKDKIAAITSALTDTLNIYTHNRKLVDVLIKYATQENAEAVRELLESLNDPDVKTAIKLLADPAVKGFMSKLPGIMAQLENVSPILSELQKDMLDPELQKEIAALPETVSALSEIGTLISDTSDELDALITLFSDDGSRIVEELIQSLDADELGNLTDKYGNILEDGDIIVELAEQWLSFGREYGLYSDSTPEMKTNLAFILNTPSIENTADIVTDKTEADENIPWYKKLFS